MKELLDYLYELFPVPDHNHFQMLPVQEQYRILGQGQVMIEITKYYEELAK